jgi:Ser/Thr protein kinase RdoA (MazF antagonist)
MSAEVEFQALSHYPGNLVRGDIKSLGNAGGFSGAQLWRIEHAGKSYCLRRWPREHPSSKRLSFIHRVLQHVGGSGVQFVPTPHETLDGESFVNVGGHYWELTRWLAGEADYSRQPTESKLAAALKALARFHTAAAFFEVSPLEPSRSHGIEERYTRLKELIDGRANRINLALKSTTTSELSSIGRRILDLFARHCQHVLGSVAEARKQPVHQQPCIRDVWHDHILFVENDVTGIVDFGAMRIESVAGDVARLLGSLAKDNRELWRIGMNSYEAVRSLSDVERKLIRVFDETTVLLSGMNWLEWIYVDGRQFDGVERILFRLNETLARLEHLTNGPAEGELIWKQ